MSLIDSLFRHCIVCDRIIWPWQRVGWYVVSDHHVNYWHGRCYHRAPR